MQHHVIGRIGRPGDTPLPGHLSRVCERGSSGSIIGHCDRINIGGA